MGNLSCVSCRTQEDKQVFSDFAACFLLVFNASLLKLMYGNHSIGVELRWINVGYTSGSCRYCFIVLNSQMPSTRVYFA